MDCPGRPVVKTSYFQCREHRFNPCLGNWDLTCCTAWPKKLKTERKKERKKEKILKSSIGFRPRYLDCHTSAVWLNLYQTLMIFVFTHHFISNARYTLCLKTLRVKKWVSKMDLSPTFAREVKKSQHTSHEKMWRIWKFDFGFISEQRETNHRTF